MSSGWGSGLCPPRPQRRQAAAALGGRRGEDVEDRRAEEDKEDGEDAPQRWAGTSVSPMPGGGNQKRQRHCRTPKTGCRWIRPRPGGSRGWKHASAIIRAKRHGVRHGMPPWLGRRSRPPLSAMGGALPAPKAKAVILTALHGMLSHAVSRRAGARRSQVFFLPRDGRKKVWKRMGRGEGNNLILKRFFLPRLSHSPVSRGCAV